MCWSMILLLKEEECLLQGSILKQSDHNGKKYSETSFTAAFILPLTRSRRSLPPTMPTLPEEEEDSPEEVDSTSSSPSTVSAHSL